MRFNNFAIITFKTLSNNYANFKFNEIDKKKRLFIIN